MKAAARWSCPPPASTFPASPPSRIESRRKPVGQPETTAVRYFLLSAPLTPQRALDVARTHWSIENRLHWVLDVAFGEDAARNRKDHGPQNFALLRKLALNLQRQHPETGSIKGKLKRAGWNDDFLLSLLGHMR
jgi:hypothetical protein